MAVLIILACVMDGWGSRGRSPGFLPWCGGRGSSPSVSWWMDPEPCAQARAPGADANDLWVGDHFEYTQSFGVFPVAKMSRHLRLSLGI